MLKKILLAASVVALTSIQVLPALAGQTEQASPFRNMSDHYLAIQTALAGDAIDPIAKHALAIEKLATQMNAKATAATLGVTDKDAALCAGLMPAIASAAGKLSKARNIKDARAAFGELSDSMVKYRDMIPGEKPNVAYCPMAKKSWLQDGKTIANPYFGSSMLRCGNIVNK